MKLSYLPADERDIEAIYALERALIEQYEDMASIDADEVFAWVRRKLTKRIGEYLRIVCDGETAGYIRVVPPEDGRVELDDLYLYPKYQGRGIGTAVLRRCIEQTELPLWLYVFRRNTRAIALYERLGFRIVETISPTRCIMQREAEE